jgi:hypothetical protein
MVHGKFATRGGISLTVDAAFPSETKFQVTGKTKWRIQCHEERNRATVARREVVSRDGRVRRTLFVYRLSARQCLRRSAPAAISQGCRESENVRSLLTRPLGLLGWERLESVLTGLSADCLSRIPAVNCIAARSHRRRQLHAIAPQCRGDPKLSNCAR